MARFLFSRLDNHQIARGGLNNRQIQDLRRAWDPITVVRDGLSHGNRIESTQFNFSSRWSVEIGTPNRSNELWRHPTTGLPFTVNPRFYIVEVPTVPHDGVVADLFMEEGAPDPERRGNTLQRKARRLQPANFTAARLSELTATHRLRLTLGQFNAVMGLRATLL